ncbi:MAG: GNAT family N-acetyltransferase [Chloroflexi bacterium]|nr:GNAT family N-acetyltransferase [Chloroflexota bacterium]
MAEPTRPGRLRDLDVTRDLGPVADLLEQAFAGDLDEYGRRVIREMRSYHRLAPILGTGLRVMLGWGHSFTAVVWEVDGRVVGHAMAVRSWSDTSRWQVANVAVDASFRGRGIGRALMVGLLERLQAFAPEWIVLQVREENQVARHLYESLGFHTLCGEIHWYREATQPLLPASPPALSLRPLRFYRLSALHRLLDRSFTPEGLWWWMVRYPRPRRSFAESLKRLVGLWVEERWGYWEEGRLLAVVGLRGDRSQQKGEWIVRVDRSRWGQWEPELIRWALIRSRQLGLLQLRTVTEMGYDALNQTLAQEGFRPRHRLLNMRLRGKMDEGDIMRKA